jgi:hypothetical protein
MIARSLLSAFPGSVPALQKEAAANCMGKPERWYCNSAQVKECPANAVLLMSINKK